MKRTEEKPYQLPIRTTACCLLLLLLLTRSLCSYSQKYNFINFNVENGLNQSQVTTFAQNSNNELLIGTFGGFSIFDGSNFINYNKGNGLPQNQVKTIACDLKHNVWLGTSSGIARFDGKSFQSYAPLFKSEENNVQKIEVDIQNNVWAHVNYSLFHFGTTKFEKDRPGDTVTCLAKDNTGNIWIAVYAKGVYVYNGKQWKQEIDLSHDRNMLIVNIFFGKKTGTLYIRSNKGIDQFDNGHLQKPNWLKTLPAKGFVSDLIEDSKGNVWLSMNDGGAWLYNQQNWVHYTYQNGLTDDNVNSFFEDKEGNIWIGTNGSGIYRYTGSIFTYYDRSSGLSSPSIMSIAQDKSGTIYFAGNTAGLYKLINGNPKKIDLPLFANKINALVTDSTGNLWLGTEQSFLWKYSDKKAKIFIPSVTQNAFLITNLYRDVNTIWISSLEGLFSLNKDSLSGIPHLRDQIHATIYATLSMGQDSLLLGTLKGVYIYRTDLHQLVPKPLIENSTTLCFASDAQNIYIGTDDRGVVVWNRVSKKMTVINHKSGLTCDYIYSLLVDKNGNIWVGTGCGIDKINITDKGIHIRNFGKSDGLLGVENNANASFEDREGYLWFGTTKGVFKYNPYITGATQQAPKVVLQSVKLFSKDLPEGKYSDSTTPFNGLVWNPILPPGQNHIAFTFKGIYLSNPEKIKYRYQLIGIDKTYTETDQNTVVYPNLPPGNYRFKVWASDADDNWYKNAVYYPFTINAPYYTTWYFRLGLGLLCIGIFLAAVYYRNRQKEMRRRWEDKLREEQQALVRQKTAEDFHDEIGNKLTRINLLATVAENKLQKTQPDIQKILQQIQQNVTSLYHGSKDIIWSLQPDSDFMDEIIFRIQQNTDELLQDTKIRFEYIQDPDLETHIKLPIDYSRNIIMIFKEAVNNAVKHAGCNTISLSVKDVSSGTMLFELADNGRGFEKATLNKGNGLGNMTNRAARIGARLEWESEPGKGTQLKLYLKV